MGLVCLARACFVNYRLGVFLDSRAERARMTFFNSPPPWNLFAWRAPVSLTTDWAFFWIPRDYTRERQIQLLSLNETTTRRALSERSEFASLGLNLATVFSLRVSFSFPHFLFLCFATKKKKIECGFGGAQPP